MPFFAHNSKLKRGELTSSISSSSSYASSSNQVPLNSSAPPVPIKDNHNRLPRFSSSPSFAAQRHFPCTPPRKNSADSSLASHTSSCHTSSLSSSYSSSPENPPTSRVFAPLALKSLEHSLHPQRSLLLSLQPEAGIDNDVTQQQPLAQFNLSGDIDIMLSSSTSADDFDDLDIDLKRVVSKNPLTGAPVVRYRLRLRHRRDRSNSPPSRLPVPPFSGSPTPSPLSKSFKTRSKHTSAPMRHLADSLERSSLDRIPSSSSSPRISNASDFPSPGCDPSLAGAPVPPLLPLLDEYESSSASVTEPPDTPQGLDIPFSSMFPVVHTSANYITRDNDLEKFSFGLSASDNVKLPLPSPDRSKHFGSTSAIEDDIDADIELNMHESKLLKKRAMSSSAASPDKVIIGSPSSPSFSQFRPPRRTDSFTPSNRLAPSSNKSRLEEKSQPHIRLTASHWSETDDDD